MPRMRLGPREAVQGYLAIGDWAAASFPPGTTIERLQTGALAKTTDSCTG